MPKELQPRKSLGQHWLFDKESLEAVAAAGEIKKADTILEIGPGLGSLTQLMVKSAKKVIAVELDDTLIESLKKRFTKSLKDGKLEIINQDILKFDLRELPKNYKVVANIPYYLTSNLLRSLLESSNRPSLMALLVQKEVAERITASPGKMSILAISVQLYAKSVKKQLIPKDKFKPQPKVDSMIIQIKPYKEPLLKVQTKKFFRLVKAGFSQKRKTLKNALAAGLQIPEDQLIDIFTSNQIKNTSRAQELSLENWQKLYKSFARQKLI